MLNYSAGSVERKKKSRMVGHLAIQGWKRGGCALKASGQRGEEASRQYRVGNVKDVC